VLEKQGHSRGSARLFFATLVFAPKGRRFAKSTF